MSDDQLDIRVGGFVQIDTATLRDAAVEADGLARRAEDCADRLARLARRAEGLLGVVWEAQSVLWQAEATSSGTAAVAGDARALGDALRETAALYDAVEVAARLSFAAEAERPALERALREAVAESELRDIAVSSIAGIQRLLRQYVQREMGQSGRRFRDQVAGTLRPFGLGADSGARMLTAAMQMLATAVTGLAVQGRLRGPTVAVDVAPAGRGRVHAPRSAAEALARIPTSGSQRVRVEQYVSPGGQRQWVVYIAGTQGVFGDEAFDDESCLDLYRGMHSAADAAVEEAMRQAGVPTDEPVHLVGHSLGGMAAMEVAVGGKYRVESVLTAGSPRVREVPENVQAVTLRHDDDVVAQLNGPLQPTRNGAADSLVISRTADPAPGLHDLKLSVHQLDAYIETAEQAADTGAGGRLDRVWNALDGFDGSAVVFDVARKD